MQHKTREEAEAIIREQVSIATTDWHSHGGNTNNAFTKCGLRILDALYPKPESKRLKQLRQDREYFDTVNGRKLADPVHRDRAARMSKLIGAEIEREKAK